MFVIFPADELILMTYGAAIPRISPRPTLDCLHEPQVPIVIPARSLPPSFSPLAIPAISTTAPPAATTESPATTCSDFFTRFKSNPEQQQQHLQQLAQLEKLQQIRQQQEAQLRLELDSEEIERDPPFNLEPLVQRLQPTTYNRSILPTIIERPSPTPSVSSIPFDTSPPPLDSVRRSSKTSLKRSTPVQRTNLQQRRAITTAEPLSTVREPTYNDLNMRSTQQQLTSRPTLERSRAINSSPSLVAYNEDLGLAMGSHLQTPIQYPTGALEYASRESSPSIIIEPPDTDPTKPRLGPGWGRPMSPMEFPAEPSTSNKSPSSKSRMLRPRLHIPLGRLGRSTSNEHKESNRLREDLELQVENPIFNTENLRQRNFDAFFDSGEPVYRLQPKSPATAPSNSTTAATFPPLDNYAGVYDSPTKSRSTSKGGLFARPSKEEKLLSSRSKSAEHFDHVRDARSSSVGPTAESGSVISGGSGGGAGSGSGSGVTQKGDRFLGKIFRWSKKS